MDSIMEAVERPIPQKVSAFIGPYPETARLLGERTSELHVALASDPENPQFAPEPFSKLYQRSLYQSMRNLTGQVFRLLRQRSKGLPEELQAETRTILSLENEILQHFHSIVDQKITASRVRCHGDYHLGQVLYTGKDFVIIDFEGEPARPISERKIKRSPLRDVAGMLRSFHYAAYSGLFSYEAHGLVHGEDIGYLESWAKFWYYWVSVAFLKAYLKGAEKGRFLPDTKEEVRTLLNVFLLEKAVYELGYELNNRPAWVKIPIEGIRDVLERRAPKEI
jgi:maltose alpha-D-glucosyltransferase/alpha-amylase